MLAGAKLRFANEDSISFILGDYSQIELPQKNGLVLSVIGIHHQKTDADKQALFAKIHSILAPAGRFIFGDLFTHRDPHKAALAEVLHYHHLVTHAPNRKSLEEWAHHHRFLNCLSPLEDQVAWLGEAGFSEVTIAYERFNTALIFARK